MIHMHTLPRGLESKGNIQPPGFMYIHKSLLQSFFFLFFYVISLFFFFFKEMYLDSGQFGLLSPRTPLLPIQCTTPAAYFSGEKFGGCFFHPRCSSRETTIRLPAFYSWHIQPFNFFFFTFSLSAFLSCVTLMTHTLIFIIFRLRTTTWTLKETRNFSTRAWIHNKNNAQ